jgi:hypothetical protein
MTGTADRIGWALMAMAAAAALDARALNARGEIYASLERFEWTETMHGARFVKEEGPLGGLGGRVQLDFDGAPFGLYGMGEVYAGEVDYDGFLQTADGLIPAESETAYEGMMLEAGVVIDVRMTPSIVLQPFAGLGAHAWERDLQGVGGYVETWSTVYAAFGAALRLATGPQGEVFGLGAWVPALHNEEEVDLRRVGGPSSVDLEPKEESGFRAEAGFRVRSFYVSLYYENMSFGESELDRSGRFLQPDSEAEMIGLRGGITF